MKTTMSRSVLSVFLVLAVVFTGCGSGETDSDNAGPDTEPSPTTPEDTPEGTDTPDAGEEVTLELVLYTTAQPAWEAANGAFEDAHPNINLNVTFLPSQDLYSLMATRIQAGEVPDIFHMAPGRSTNIAAWPLGSEGLLMDLSDQEFADRVIPAVESQVSLDGALLGWPVFSAPGGALYNPELGSQIGIEPPQTMDELLEQCGVIREAGFTPFVQSMDTIAGGIIVGRILQANFVYNIDPQWDAKRYADEVTFAESPEYQRMLEVVQEMIDAECFNEGAEGTSRPQQYAMFAGGQAVYTLVTGGEIGNVRDANPDLEFELHNMPTDSGVQGAAQTYSGIALAAYAGTDHPEAVLEYLNFMAAPEQAQAIAEEAGSLSPQDVATGELPDFMAPMADLFAAGHVVEQVDATWPGPAVFREGVAQGINALFTRQQSIEQTLTQQDQLWDEAQEALPDDAPTAG